MKLTIGSGQPVSSPSKGDIEAGLASLGESQDSFAILAASEMTYIQTSGTPEAGFVLEYQLGSVDQHFRSISSELPLAVVARAFALYAAGDPTWEDVTEWRHEAIAGSGAMVGPALFGSAAVLAIVAYLVARAL